MINLKNLGISAAIGVCALLPISAFAATDSISANVPFAFVVNGRTMPAGAYEVENSESGAILYIRSSKNAVLVASNPANAATSTAKPGLVFEKRGETVYLVGVRLNAEGERNLPSPAHPAVQVGTAAALR